MYAASASHWHRRALRAVAIALLCAALMASCAAAPPARPADASKSAGATRRPTAHSSPRPVNSGAPTPDSARGSRLLRLIARVPTTAGTPYQPGYDRSCSPGHACAFGVEWTDDHPGPFGHNGCDTRQDVLLQQMHDIEMRWGSECRIYEAALADPYTGEQLTWRDDGYWIQIDHVYPLAEAWHAGAWRWPQSRRLRFANDVRRNLLAVTSRANYEKGSATPSEWLPPNRGFQCRYVTKYLRVALAYDLTITDADAAAIAEIVRLC